MRCDLNEKSWTRAREVCRVLEYDAKTSKTAYIIKAHCSPENITQKYQMSSVHASCTPINWPKDLQKYDIYINEEGMYEIVFSSQEPKAKDFRRHCCNVLFPHVWQQLTNKIKEDHQQTIEEKDATIALLNDNLQNREYENVALPTQKNVYQAELQKCQDTITHLKTRYVPHAREIPTRTTLSSFYGNIQHLPTINIMTCHTISRGYNDVKGMLS